MVIRLLLVLALASGCGKQPRDRDGDGYADDKDCNDDDPSVNPGARDIPDNGVDDNCVGGDAVREQLGPRTAPADAGQH